ncbi:MAG TPA: biosynthetic-type acetolactate synthase large subunit [Steroidobacteraceae bacterium]|nr:biosynthetic-type acetolactate synthase large subunit [Steroidobacteraceae bacterium]
MKVSGAELVIAFLEQRGVSLVAGVPGGAVLPLYEALGGSTRIRHVLARHEQSAGFIAQGMARVTGRAGVCFVTSGPGLTNVVTALADAKLDSVPLVCIAGQVSTHLIGTDAFQEVATLDIVRPITKACYFVHAAEQIAPTLAAAFHAAETGRPGPVLIDLPKNVQTQSVMLPGTALVSGPSDGIPGKPVAVGESAETPEQRAEAYARAAELIAAAQRPLFYFGGGVVKARALAAARQLVEDTGIPVTTTLMALGLLPRDHALNLGMLGMHGARYTNQVIEAADLLIAVGARFDDRATGDPRAFARNARIIHIDIDPRELGKIKQPTLGIQDDAASALRQLAQRVGALRGDRARRQAWRAQIESLRRLHPLRMPRKDRICSPYGIMGALDEALPEDAIVTTDVGQHQMWAAQTLSLPRADRWLTSGGLGTMGFGLPAAIGAALACPDSPVICITGDGSLLMNIQELATLAELDLNVKVLVLDNAALGLVRQQQELFYKRRFVASRFERGADFVAIATAFGVRAHDLGDDGALTLREVLARRGPALVRVPIDEVEHILPMVPPGASNTASVDHPEGGLVECCA